MCISKTGRILEQEKELNKVSSYTGLGSHTPHSPIGTFNTT